MHHASEPVASGAVRYGDDSREGTRQRFPSARPPAEHARCGAEPSWF
ncbi:MAG: hypothetical protein AAF411_18520 [Myxococcota bacterium]